MADEITELSITDHTGRTYLVPPGNVHGLAHGRAGLRSASGRSLWIPQGDFLAVPASGEAFSGGRPAVRWLEFCAGPGQGTRPVRLEIRPPATVPAGAAQPPWPTPAEAYLAELAPVYEWSIGSYETGSVDLDAPEIVAAVAAALLAVGALPPGSALLTAALHRERRPARMDWQRAVTHIWAGNARDRVRHAGQANGAGLAVRFPLDQATAVIETITAHEDLVSLQLYGHPWMDGESWPMILPCFRSPPSTTPAWSTRPCPTAPASPRMRRHRLLLALAPSADAGQTAPGYRQHPVGSCLGGHQHSWPLTRSAPFPSPVQRSLMILGNETR